MDEFSLNEMRTWGQSKSLSFCFCAWCNSRELGGRESSRFPYDGAPLLKQPMLGVSAKKAPPQTCDWIPYVDMTRGAVNLGVWGGWTGRAWHW